MTPENKRRLAYIIGVATVILAARATLEYARIHASDIDESDDSSSVSRFFFLLKICLSATSLHDVESCPAPYQYDEDSDVNEHRDLRSTAIVPRKRKRSKSTSGPSKKKDGGRRKSRRISLDEALLMLEDVTQSATDALITAVVQFAVAMARSADSDGATT